MFVSGTSEGLMVAKGRKHNAEDIKSTVLAVDPIKFVHKGRYVAHLLSILWPLGVQAQCNVTLKSIF